MKAFLRWTIFLALPLGACAILLYSSGLFKQSEKPETVTGLSGCPAEDFASMSPEKKAATGGDAKKNPGNEKSGKGVKAGPGGRGTGRDSGNRTGGEVTSSSGRSGRSTPGSRGASRSGKPGAGRAGAKTQGSKDEPGVTVVTGEGADETGTGESEKEESVLPASLSGKIVDVFRHPIRGAAIIAEGEIVDARTSSGLDGTFNLENITPAAEFRFIIAAIGMVDFTSEGLKLGSGEHRDLGEIKLSSHGGLRAYVTGENGHPVADAKVILEVIKQRWVEGLDVRHEQLANHITDMYGLAVFREIAPGEYEIEVSHPDYATARVREITVSGEGPVDVSVVIVNQVTISGHVYNEFDEAFPGVKVEARSNIIGASFSQHVYSAEDGSYAVPVQPRSRCTVTATAHGYKEKNLTLVQAGTHNFDIDMVPEPGSFLHARVIDKETREAIPRFWVDGQEYNNSSGMFTLRRTPGSHTLKVDAPGYATKQVTFEMPDNEFDLPDIEMTRGATVSGTVKKPDASACPGAAVSVQKADRNATTNGDGNFKILNVPAGDWKIVASHPDFGPGEANVTGLVDGGEVSGIVIQLKPGGYVAKAIVVNSSDEPVNGAKVEIIGTTFTATTDGNGAFIITGIANPKVQVKITCDGYIEKIYPATIPADPNYTPPKIVLSRPTVIHGQVMVGENPAPEGIEVKLLDSARHERVTLTASEGKYEFGDLTPGKYYVGIPSMFLVRRLVTLEEGKPVEKNFAASPVVWSGTVYNTDGNPVPNAFVNIFRRENWALVSSFTANPQGQFAANYLKPGQYVLHLSKTSCVTNYFSLDIEIPEDTVDFRHDLHYLPTPGKMLVRLTNPDGTPAAGLDLRIEEMGPSVPNMHAALGSTNASGISVIEYLVVRPHRACVISWIGRAHDKPGVTYSPIVEILENGNVSETEVVVNPVGKRLFGKVTVSDGDRPDYLYTWVLDGEGHLRDYTPYHNTDKYWIDSIYPGEWTVRFSAPGYMVKDVQMTILGDETGCPAVVLEKEPE